ncbi:MAG: TlpA family protein disulfide reductase [Phycisphaerales bacterium]|nr:TlpA family protein disulfide reductase [Phycisphaerales bacterium]
MPIRTLRLCIAMFFAVVLGAGSSARAQDQGALDVLDASRAALNATPGFSAQFRMKGEGGSMFAATLPSMNGQLFFGTNEELGRVVHCIGEARDQQSASAEPIDILVATDRLLWTDAKKRTITERPISKRTRGLPSAFALVLIDAIVQDDPFAKDTNNAQSIELLAQETVSDVLCDVVHIKRAKPEGRSRSGSDSYTDVRWFIAVEDKLPRKVEHITDAGMVKITLLLELGTMNMREPPQIRLDVSRPNGFTFTSTMPKPKADEPDDLNNSTTQAQNTQRPPVTPAEPIGPSIRYTPAFAFTPDGASEINNTTQDERITVLYFWGSWCIPCTETSPMVSELTEQFAGGDQPVDIFGLAIREADNNQTIADFADKGFSHRLVLDADHMVSLFKARVFPTLVVIAGDGEIIFQGNITKDLSSEDLVAQAKDAILGALVTE